MKTKAVRLYGADDLRLEEFELPEIKDNEVLLRVVSDSLCTSTYKAVKQGSKHKRVPPDIAEKPIIVGHEMSGEIVAVGETLKDRYRIGQNIVIQPALKLESCYDPGYSYQYIGGSAKCIFSGMPVSSMKAYIGSKIGSHRGRARRLRKEGLPSSIL